MIQVAQERQRLSSTLQKFSDGNILQLPQMNDKNKERCLMALTRLIDPCYHVKANALSEVIQIRCILMTLEDGLSKYASASFVAAAQYTIAVYQDVKEGARFVSLAEKLLYLSPAGTSHYAVATVKSVTDASRKNLKLCMEGYRLGMENGEISAAYFAVTIYTWSFYYGGLPFLPLLDDMKKFTQQMLEYHQHFLFLHNLPLWQCLLCLSGQSDDPCDVGKGEAIEMRKLLVSNTLSLGKEATKSYGMHVAFYMGDIEKATEFYSQVVDFTMSYLAKATSIYLGRVFFFGLICVANAKSGNKKYKQEAKKHISYIRKLVESGALNLVHKLQILDAEIGSLDTTSSDVNGLLRGYEVALVNSTKAGFIQDAALCAYLAGEFCSSNPLELSRCVETYLMKSHELYLTWGATAVAASVRDRHPTVFENKDICTEAGNRSSGLQSRTRFEDSIAKGHRTLS